MRILILGYIIRGPLGGLCWHYLQYMLGCKLAGHEILFLEDSDSWPSCYDPVSNEMSKDPTYGIKFIKLLFKKYGLENCWAYFDEHTNQFLGQTELEVRNYCRSADIVINISNVNPLRDWWGQIPIRILVDTDPAFTQIRHIEENNFKFIAQNHTHFFTFGENFGKKECLIPDDGFNWKPTRQPVVLELWEVSPQVQNSNWTTVMQWDSYKSREINGIRFGMKSASFKDYLDFPNQNADNFELAVGGATTPEIRLEAGGWKLADPLTIAKTAESFQQYIRHSKGEFSIAKQGYVVSNSAWFSERSAGYLASGRPVILQETGYSKIIETGKGLFSFSTPEEAAEAIKQVNMNYKQHCRSARDIAESFFDSNLVITTMFNQL